MVARVSDASLVRQILCVRREIALRKRVYPGFIERGRLKPETAAREIESMEAVHETLITVAVIAGVEVPE